MTIVCARSPGAGKTVRRRKRYDRIRAKSIRCIDIRIARGMVRAVNKSEQLQIRISAEDKARIRERAAEAGMDVSKWVLHQVLPPVEEEFRAKCEELAASPDGRSYAFAELHDLLAKLSGSELERAVRHAPGVPLPPFEANYLAATIEYAAASKGVPPPRWTSAVSPLREPWFASSLASLRLYLLTRSPPPFRRRNLFVDSSVGQRV